VSASDESNLAEIFRIRNLKQVNILACKEARERRETRMLESGRAGDRKSAFRADRCRSICRRSRSSKRKFRISMTGLPKDISDDYLGWIIPPAVPTARECVITVRRCTSARFTVGHARGVSTVYACVFARASVCIANETGLAARSFTGALRTKG